MTYWHCKTHNADIPLDDAEKRIERHEEFHSPRVTTLKSSISKQSFKGNVNTEVSKCEWVYIVDTENERRTWFG